MASAGFVLDRKMTTKGVPSPSGLFTQLGDPDKGEVSFF